MMKQTIIVGVIAAVLGIGVGAAASSGESAPDAKPEVVVETVEAEPEVVTETVEVEVASTPDSCIVALDTAEEALGLSAESMLVSIEAVTAASEMDLAGIQSATEGFASINDRLDPLVTRYNNAAPKCRASN